MISEIKTPTKIKLDSLEDLKEYKKFMDDNNLKINIAALSRKYKVDRRTINKYLNGFEKKKTKNKSSKLDKYYDLIKSLLSSSTQTFSYIRVLRQYLEDNYGIDIQYSTFYNYIRNTPEFYEYFKKGKCLSSDANNIVIRFETPPGNQMQIDWKESIPFVLSDTREIIEVNILVGVLGFSRYKMYKVSLLKTRTVLMSLLTEMFENIKGVPKTIITDNMKPVMNKPRTRYFKGEVNSQFEGFSKDFGFKVIPCKAKNPQTKGKVESQMKILDEIRAYSGTLTLSELVQLVERINTRENNKLSQATDKIPIFEFEKEKDSLLSLPPEKIRNQYRIKTKTSKVNSAGMITVDTKQYSVGRKYIGQKLQYQVIDSNIYIYSNTKLIEMHEISNIKINYNPEHYKDGLKNKFSNKEETEIEKIAKQNLNSIGGVYINESN